MKYINSFLTVRKKTQFKNKKLYLILFTYIGFEPDIYGKIKLKEIEKKSENFFELFTINDKSKALFIFGSKCINLYQNVSNVIMQLVYKHIMYINYNSVF